MSLRPLDMAVAETDDGTDRAAGNRAWSLAMAALIASAVAAGIFLAGLHAAALAGAC